MLCKNCGAEIAEDILLCPYCGAENEEVAEREHKEEIEDILDRAAQLETRPEEIAGKMKARMNKIALYAVIGLLVVLFAVFVVTRLIGDQSANKMKKELNTLEKYYDAREFGKMKTYFNSLENTLGERYKKYRNVISHYERSERQKEYLEEAKKRLAKGNMGAELMEVYLDGVQSTFYKFWEAEQEGFRYDEGDGIQYMKEELQHVLMETVGITEAEITLYFDGFTEGEERPDLMPLAEDLVIR